jgi:phospholipase C
MAIVFSRSGLNAELRADLPFNNTLRISVGNGGEDTTSAFDTTRNTHLWLLFNAASLLENEGAVGQQIHRVIKPEDAFLNDDFRDALCQGLWDADKKAPYNSPVLEVIPTWKSHFYDPDTGTNWMGQTAPTALSEGVRFYWVSQRAYRRGDWVKAGYAFGLALHYLTDLTQPMHAANFTWLDSQGLGFHTDFERYVKATLHQINPPRVYEPLLSQTSIEDYFHAVARRSKDTYYSRVCKPEWTQHYDEAARSHTVWNQRIGVLVPLILADAVQMTTQFLLMWFKDASPSAVPTLQEAVINLLR